MSFSQLVTETAIFARNVSNSFNVSNIASAYIPGESSALAATDFVILVLAEAQRRMPISAAHFTFKNVNVSFVFDTRKTFTFKNSQ